MSRFCDLKQEVYEKAIRIIRGKEWKEARLEGHKIDWDDYHMSLAWKASERSPDHQTKVGAHLTNEDHHPISSGYNGFPRKVNDNMLPNLRPEKYPWMIHAEINAILNASIQGKSTKDTILYCTHRPCFNCTLFIWQAGCRHVVYDNSSSTKLSDNEETDIQLAIFDIVTNHRMRIRGINFNPK